MRTALLPFVDSLLFCTAVVLDCSLKREEAGVGWTLYYQIYTEQQRTTPEDRQRRRRKKRWWCRVSQIGGWGHLCGAPSTPCWQNAARSGHPTAQQCTDSYRAASASISLSVSPRLGPSSILPPFPRRTFSFR